MIAISWWPDETEESAPIPEPPPTPRRPAPLRSCIQSRREMLSPRQRAEISYLVSNPKALTEMLERLLK